MEQQVIVGKTYQKAFGGPTQWLTTNVEAQNPKRITLDEACEEMAMYWRCTPENARESLEKHGSPHRLIATGGWLGVGLMRGMCGRQCAADFEAGRAVHPADLLSSTGPQDAGGGGGWG